MCGFASQSYCFLCEKCGRRMEGTATIHYGHADFEDVHCLNCGEALDRVRADYGLSLKLIDPEPVTQPTGESKPEPDSPSFIYPVIPKDRYKHADCPRALQAIRDRFPGAVVIDTPDKFCGGPDWLENWPHLLPRVKALVVCPREDGSIALGGYQELASASTFRTTLNHFESLPPVLCGDRHFPDVEVLVLKNGRFYRLDIARTLYSRAECGRIGASLGRRASPWERSKRQWFAEVVAGDEVT
jgi:hypothetical protein